MNRLLPGVNLNLEIIQAFARFSKMKGKDEVGGAGATIYHPGKARGCWPQFISVAALILTPHGLLGVAKMEITFHIPDARN